VCKLTIYDHAEDVKTLGNKVPSSGCIALASNEKKLTVLKIHITEGSEMIATQLSAKKLTLIPSKVAYIRKLELSSKTAFGCGALSVFSISFSTAILRPKSMASNRYNGASLLWRS
jgi:hypothetical protein